MKKLCIAILLSLIVIAISSTAYAQTFLCGRVYVRTGMHKERLWEQCGRPKSRSTLGFDYGGQQGERKDAVKNEKWVYVQSNSAYIVYIKGGIVSRIEKTPRW